MLVHQQKDKEGASAEQLRLTVAIAIIATTIGIFALNKENDSLVTILQAFTIIPSLLFGLYLLFTAAYLKYNKPATIGDLSIPEKARRGCYDTGVDLFWAMFLIFIVIFFAGLFGWSGDMANILEFWPSLIISCIVLLAIALVSELMAGKEISTKRKRRSNLQWRRR